jgi:hypothetical protein
MTTAILIGAIIAGVAVCPLLHWLGGRRGQPACSPALKDVRPESEIRASQAHLQARVDTVARERGRGQARDAKLRAAGARATLVKAALA